MDVQQEQYFRQLEAEAEIEMAILSFIDFSLTSKELRDELEYLYEELYSLEYPNSISPIAPEHYNNV